MPLTLLLTLPSLDPFSKVGARVGFLFYLPSLTFSDHRMFVPKPVPVTEDYKLEQLDINMLSVCKEDY